jgi:uncharacterized membrane protein YqaE (UPF0057 family)
MVWSKSGLEFREKVRSLTIFCLPPVAASLTNDTAKQCRLQNVSVLLFLAGGGGGVIFAIYCIKK